MEAQRSTTERLIAHAAVAGGLRLAARKIPDAAAGLLKAAEFHTARCCGLMDEICATQAAEVRARSLDGRVER